ncbi:type IV-A pilus assembly ATPase PilB [Salinibius halmophilus]|uniref:type IV-A pilus assembly ATPase PilB n=1 Tax=Salinibius halmophilus TaxID=1853216 RepID=UPI000E65EB75|nr:type IV-A pilus assembly ATPase PilB [Salinibius halmophilus]
MSSFTGLPKRLFELAVVDEKKLVEAVDAARQKKLSLVSLLVEEYGASAKDVAMAAAEEFGMPWFDLTTFDFTQWPENLVDSKLIEKHKALPLLKRGNRLYVAISDPSNQVGLDEIKFNTGLTVDGILVEHNKLAQALEKALDDTPASLGDFDDDELSGIEAAEQEDRDAQQDSADAANDAPVVKFINQMLLSAIKKGASDLHFEPYERSYRVRFRIDGVLETMSKPPIALSPKISARLKVLSSMDIAERRVPQDGRIKLKISKTKSIDFRVNTLPTLWGEKIVLRILDSSSAKMGIDALGYEEVQKEMYLNALSKPQGMILVTGPTGSGKTVSLYTGLNILNTEGVNISTAEDPVEINLEGINQVNVSQKVGLDFAQALRAFLRQDPDVVMVGEIRDLETAGIAIKAAQTGHLVLSTLHTNSAAETLTRLQNMGVPSFNLATTVNLIIAQRLARRLCKHCKKKADIPKEALLKEGFTEELLEAAQIYEPIGCEQCNKGYKGRVGIYEVVKVTPAISKIIMDEGNAITLNEQFQREGFNNLRQSGLMKVAQGVTSLQEANRVTTE